MRRVNAMNGENEVEGGLIAVVDSSKLFDIEKTHAKHVRARDKGPYIDDCELFSVPRHHESHLSS